MLLGLAVFVAVPLYGPMPGGSGGGRRIELEARREELAGALRELEWDHGSGLVDPEDYRRQRRAHEEELAAVLRDLEGTD